MLGRSASDQLQLRTALMVRCRPDTAVAFRPSPYTARSQVGEAAAMTVFMLSLDGAPLTVGPPAKFAFLEVLATNGRDAVTA